MKFINTILFLVLGFSAIHAQTDNPNLLVNIPKASQMEINAYTPSELEIGMLVYNTNEDAIYKYTSNGFVEILTGQSTYSGSFLIKTTGDTTMTGLPFKPSSITMVAHTNIEKFNIDADNGVGNNNNGTPNAFGSMNGFARQDGANIIQQVIYVGGSGNSINDISRYASSDNCIGLRYSNQNGDAVGKTIASLKEFTDDGFTLNVSSLDDNVVVLFTAYR